MKHEEWYFPEQKNKLELAHSFIPDAALSGTLNVDLKGKAVTEYEEMVIHPDGSRTVRRARKKTSASVYFVKALTVIALVSIFMKGGDAGGGGDDGDTKKLPVEIVHRGVVKADGDVNVRTCPSIKGKVLGVLEDGDYLDYLGFFEEDDSGRAWYKVQFGGCEAWISSKYSNLFVPQKE